MTLEQALQLSPEERRVKMATLHGWRMTQISVNSPNDDVTMTPPGLEINPWRDVNETIPDYDNSLDSVSQVENLIPVGMKRWKYWEILASLTKPKHHGATIGETGFAGITATAHQRTTAILATMLP